MGPVGAKLGVYVVLWLRLLLRSLSNGGSRVNDGSRHWGSRSRGMRVKVSL